MPFNVGSRWHRHQVNIPPTCDQTALPHYETSIKRIKRSKTWFELQNFLLTVYYLPESQKISTSECELISFCIRQILFRSWHLSYKRRITEDEKSFKARTLLKSLWSQHNFVWRCCSRNKYFIFKNILFIIDDWHFLLNNNTPVVTPLSDAKNKNKNVY